MAVLFGCIMYRASTGLYKDTLQEKLKPFNNEIRNRKAEADPIWFATVSVIRSQNFAVFLLDIPNDDWRYPTNGARAYLVTKDWQRIRDKQSPYRSGVVNTNTTGETWLWNQNWPYNANAGNSGWLAILPVSTVSIWFRNIIKNYAKECLTFNTDTNAYWLRLRSISTLSNWRNKIMVKGLPIIYRNKSNLFVVNYKGIEVDPNMSFECVSSSEKYR